MLKCAGIFADRHPHHRTNGLERHDGRVPAGLRARIVQRLLALNTAI